MEDVDTGEPVMATARVRSRPLARTSVRYAENRRLEERCARRWFCIGIAHSYERIGDVFVGRLLISAGRCHSVR